MKNKKNRVNRGALRASKSTKPAETPVAITEKMRVRIKRSATLYPNTLGTIVEIINGSMGYRIARVRLIKGASRPIVSYAFDQFDPELAWDLGAMANEYMTNREDRMRQLDRPGGELVTMPGYL